ncbi:hypothetical protein HY041_02100 [Candidatus Roizmanbacteria bacterium]|nr:hypothetical protein [Candidatus Roizmanbacteria bacterium]
MNFDQEIILKFLVAGGLIAFILLLINFQFLFAIIVLIVAIISYILLNRSQSS